MSPRQFRNRLSPEEMNLDVGMLESGVLQRHIAWVVNAVGTQRAYFELKYFKIVKMRDAK